jgi:hypothetical protein
VRHYATRPPAPRRCPRAGAMMEGWTTPYGITSTPSPPSTGPCSTASTGWSSRHPDAEVVLSYQIPTYKVGRRRLFVGAWKHGLSIYGWERGRAAAFTQAHPELKTTKGTIQLRPEDAAGISDEELRDLARAALDG